jgi:hypothetical protein
MSIILKNRSPTDNLRIYFANGKHVTVAANSQLDILEVKSHEELRDSKELPYLIDSLALTVNDGTQDISDTALAKKFIKAHRSAENWYWNAATFTAGSYQQVVKIPYAGTARTGVPTKFEITTNIGAGSADIRVIDRSNGDVVIAEKTGIATGLNIGLDMGTLSNLPIDKALLEFQGKKSSGSGDNEIFSLRMEFE